MVNEPATAITLRSVAACDASRRRRPTRRRRHARASAIHDLRGGAVSALLLEVSIPEAKGRPAHAPARLARACLKLIRTLVEEIDAPARARDLESRPHSLSSLAASVESYRGSRGQIRLALHHDSTAVVAASCTELGTIERVTFNLLDNASRHARAPHVEAWLLVVGHHLRVAVENTISAEDTERLADLANDPKRLYGAFSTSGSGLGLQTVADLVGNAYGIASLETLVGNGYVGWRAREGSFISWFHWPLAAEP